MISDEEWGGAICIDERFLFGVKGSDTSAYVLLYMLDGGESEVTGSAAVCAADLVYYAAEGERLVGLVKTRRLMAMQKQQKAKVGMTPMQNNRCQPIPPKSNKGGRVMK